MFQFKKSKKLGPLKTYHKRISEYICFVQSSARKKAGSINTEPPQTENVARILNPNEN